MKNKTSRTKVNDISKPTDLLGSKAFQLHKNRIKNFNKAHGIETIEVDENAEFLQKYLETMKLNIIGPRIGKNEKNEHNFKFTYRNQMADFDWPDIQSDATRAESTALSDLDKAVKATSTMQRSSSGPNLYAWKSLNEKKPKLDVKVLGDPNKLKNYSNVCLKTSKNDVKRYETTSGSTFNQKREEMINRRNSFACSKPHPLIDHSMENQVKKFMFTPWKKPENWLHSFKPGNPDKVKQEYEQKLKIKQIQTPFMKTLIDMNANKLEYKPSFLTSMKEAFVPRNEFNEDRRLDQKLKRMYSQK